MQVRVVTSFGEWLDNHMRSQNPPMERVELARRSGIDNATLGRWLRDETRPSPANLARVAPAIGVAIGDLMTLAGYGAPTTPAPEVTAAREIDELCLELNDMLSPNSPLPDDVRERTRLIVDQVMEVARPYMKKRRRRSA